MLLWIVFAGCASEGTRSNRVVQEFLTITAALKHFEREAGRLPTEEEGLRALVEKPATYPSDRNWKQVISEVPRDPWGMLYQYVASPELEGGFGLYSFGKDGISRSQGNDPGDWNTWDEHGIVPGPLKNPVKELPMMSWLASVALVWGVVAVFLGWRARSEADGG